MDTNTMPLCYLQANTVAVVTKLLTNQESKRRLMDLGFVKGAVVQTVHISFFGDPAAYKIKGTVIALRKNDAKNILVQNL